jgi:hypothetical protein
MSVLHYTFPNSGPVTIGIENVGAVKSFENVEVNTRVFDNPNITSAAANQLAAAANKQSSNPFAVKLFDSCLHRICCHIWTSSGCRNNNLHTSIESLLSIGSSNKSGLINWITNSPIIIPRQTRFL